MNDWGCPEKAEAEIQICPGEEVLLGNTLPKRVVVWNAVFCPKLKSTRVLLATVISIHKYKITTKCFSNHWSNQTLIKTDGLINIYDVFFILNHNFYEILLGFLYWIWENKIYLAESEW